MEKQNNTSISNLIKNDKVSVRENWNTKTCAVIRTKINENVDPVTEYIDLKG